MRKANLSIITIKTLSEKRVIKVSHKELERLADRSDSVYFICSADDFCSVTFRLVFSMQDVV